MLLLTAGIFYFLGGTPIPLTTCYNFSCSVNYANENDAQCRKMYYYFNTLEECNGKYVSTSARFLEVGKKTELHSDNKHRIGFDRQLRRNLEILFGGAYKDNRSFEMCRNREQAAAHEEKCIPSNAIN